MIAPQVPFHKVAGGGNDFILIDRRTAAGDAQPPGGSSPEGPAAWARVLCRRGVSVGADGLLVVGSSEVADLALEYYNADGSRAFCGNGVLCAARWAHAVAGLPARLSVATDAGVIAATVQDSRVEMEVPSPSGWRDGLSLAPSGLAGTATAVNTGCPHLVVVGMSPPEDRPFPAVARPLRHHPDLGEGGANVDFVTVEGEHALHVRTFERGVEAETLASGTGCLAAALTAARQDLVSSPVTCHTRGGETLVVVFRRQAERFDRVTLQGTAWLVFSGRLGPDAGMARATQAP